MDITTDPINVSNLIKDKKSKFRETIKSMIKKPANPKGLQTVSPLVGSSHPSILGTAADYLIRFKTEIINPPELKKNPHPWVAESMSKSFGGHGLDIIQEAKTNLATAIQQGILSDNLISSALKLARLEGMFWSRQIRPLDNGISSADLKDLRSIVDKADAKTLTAKNQFYLNPIFGFATPTFNIGADGDIIIDDMLIDIKTYKDPKVSWNDFCQLICYMILMQIHKMIGNPEIENFGEVSKIGLYFTRHNFFWIINFFDLISQDEFKTVAMQFYETSGYRS
jgi:hypothetical protein